MFHRVVLFQPIGAGGSGDPVPVVPPPTEPAPGQGIPPSDGGVSDSLPLVQPPNIGATQELCEKANSEATLATLGYGLGASLLALLVFVVLEKKLVWTRGVRLGFSVTLGSIVASALAFTDPARGDQFKLCLNDPANVIYLTLGTQPVARALAFGLTPALLLTLLLCLVARRFV